MELLTVLSTKFTVGDGCWEWTASRDRDGYGLLGKRADTTSTRAHRIVYELFSGPIPDGLVVDHLCRNTGCVRPDHLEPVTVLENTRRGKNKALRVAPMQCKNGHAWDEANTWIRKEGSRECRACRRDALRRLHARRKAA